ncbi:MAG: S8 family serine peptidase [Steroidobacteraceae bacterium]
MRSLIYGLIGCALVCATSRPAHTAPERATISSQSDLPHFSYPINGSASALIDADDPTFAAFAKEVRANVERVLNDYDIKDRSTLRELLSEKLDLQELDGQYQDALQTVASLRALEDKPSQKLTSGLFVLARLQAAIDAHAVGNVAYEQAFTKHYGAAIDPLPWDVVQDSVRNSYASARLRTRAAVIGGVQTDIDPAVSKSGAVNNIEAADLIAARNELEAALPLGAARAAVLQEYIAKHNTPKPDIWTAREVTLDRRRHLTPVLVGIWDSGIDVTLFPDQLHTDRKATASGTHGLAFDDQGFPSQSWLHPLTPEQRDGYSEVLELIKGVNDLREGLDSSDAEAAVKKYTALSVEQAHQLNEETKVIGHFIHGTHCAGIAVRGNPAARLVVARFNDQLPDLPFPPSEAWARKLGADFRQMADYFRTRHVRVVNMSWGDEPQEFETWLSKTGGGADPVERKRQAAELFAIWRHAIETAIKSAPGTLFITAAGNSDSDPGFMDDVPASLRLPNLITVGAVNQAGDETAFTSSGDIVAVHADGYHVESLVPGGTRLKLSGTSMASPNVVNLAAKLLALDPSLTPKEVIALIRRGATASEDGRLQLIDEKQSVALLGERRKTSPAAAGT